MSIVKDEERSWDCYTWKLNSLRLAKLVEYNGMDGSGMRIFTRFSVACQSEQVGAA